MWFPPLHTHCRNPPGGGWRQTCVSQGARVVGRLSCLGLHRSGVPTVLVNQIERERGREANQKGGVTSDDYEGVQPPHNFHSFQCAWTLREWGGGLQTRTFDKNGQWLAQCLMSGYTVDSGLLNRASHGVGTTARELPKKSMPLHCIVVVCDSCQLLFFCVFYMVLPNESRPQRTNRKAHCNKMNHPHLGISKCVFFSDLFFFWCVF